MTHHSSPTPISFLRSAFWSRPCRDKHSQIRASGLSDSADGLVQVYYFLASLSSCSKTYICLLGTHFAETSMLLVMAGILSRFNISLPPSTGGSSTAQPEISFTTGITRYIFFSMPEFMPLIIFYDSHIVPFDIRIIPRPTA